MKTRTVNSLLLTCFFVVALVPLLILSVKVYDAAWDNAWREVREKHQLLAVNLAEPVNIYINSHKKDVPVISDLVSVVGTVSFRNDIYFLLENYIKNTEGLTGLTIFNTSGSSLIGTYRGELNPDWSGFNISNKSFFVEALKSRGTFVSKIIRSPATGRPALFMAHVIDFGKDRGEEKKVLVSELDLDRVEQLRKGVTFGKRGHCAIVDATGHVVAHPNPDWREEIKDLSKLKVVQKLMAGETGVTEFFSPATQEMMVAGYSSVPGLGWGILVPQPRIEVEEQVSSIILAQLGWGAMGFLLALALAVTMAHWITFPINALCKAAEDMVRNKFRKRWPEEKIIEGPREINRLAASFNEAYNGVISSKEEIKENNRSLKQQIARATQDLRTANQNLQLKASQDHLTGLHNRRSFEEYLSEMIGQDKQRKSDDALVTMIMVDVDEFKDVNDTYGHLAGDAVLTNIAQTISENLRDSDILARYAGDEFIGLIRANKRIARTRANAILEEIEFNPTIYEDQSIDVTVSIGLMECNCPNEDIDSNYWKEAIKQVDAAMYEAKEAGRNAIAEVVMDRNKTAPDPDKEEGNDTHLRIVK